jgi:predicted nuclease of restriction endonuclease-like (RecB) superfamily
MSRKLTKAKGPLSPPKELAADIERMIDEARSAVAVTVNAGLTLLYWRIGSRIHHDIMKQRRAEYGRRIVVTLSRQLVQRHGLNFNEKNLRRMIQFAEVFPEEEIVVTLLRQLSWSHFLALIPLKQPLEREFYAAMCRAERWDVRTLRQKIDSMLYERTAISRKPAQLARRELAKLREQNTISPDLVFRNPYVLNFLNLKDVYSERDLEAAILREIEDFLLEMGAGFTFVARQKRMIIDDEDFYLDLLLYHRKLRRLVAIDLKIGRFKAAYKGQMELYLRWLARHDREPDEEPPLGLILCTEGSREQIELLELDKSGIHLAQYLTELPAKQLLKRKLRDAVARSGQAGESRAGQAGEKKERKRR